MEGIHEDIHDVFNVNRGAASCYDQTAISIDSAFDDDVGKTEKTGLDARRNTDTAKGHKGRCDGWQGAERQNARALFPLLRQRRTKKALRASLMMVAKSYTGHIKLQENDKDEVQHHIRHATNDEEEKRPLRITNGAQRCRPIVIGHEKEGS